MTDPKPYICTECSDRFAKPKSFNEGDGHQTVYRPRDPKPDAVPVAHLHDTSFLPLMQGAETFFHGQRYQRWFCKACDAITLLPISGYVTITDSAGTPLFDIEATP